MGASLSSTSPTTTSPQASDTGGGIYTLHSLAFLQIFGWGICISYFNDRESDEWDHKLSSIVITLQKLSRINYKGYELEAPPQGHKLSATALHFIRGSRVTGRICFYHFSWLILPGQQGDLNLWDPELISYLEVRGRSVWTRKGTSSLSKAIPPSWAVCTQPQPPDLVFPRVSSSPSPQLSPTSELGAAPLADLRARGLSRVRCRGAPEVPEVLGNRWWDWLLAPACSFLGSWGSRDLEDALLLLAEGWDWAHVPCSRPPQPLFS